MNKKQTCWVLYLSRFDFTLKHVLETKMGKVDELGRRSNWKVDIKKDNKNQTLIKEQWIHSLTEVGILEKIKIARRKNE